MTSPTLTALRPGKGCAMKSTAKMDSRTKTKNEASPATVIGNAKPLKRLRSSWYSGVSAISTKARRDSCGFKGSAVRPWDIQAPEGRARPLRLCSEQNRQIGDRIRNVRRVALGQNLNQSADAELAEPFPLHLQLGQFCELRAVGRHVRSGVGPLQPGLLRIDVTGNSS